MERPLKIVEAAARAGANMLKLQTYTSGTMTLNISNGKFFSSNENSLWKDRNLYEFYKIAYTPRE